VCVCIYLAEKLATVGVPANGSAMLPMRRHEEVAVHRGPGQGEHPLRVPTQGADWRICLPKVPELDHWVLVVIVCHADVSCLEGAVMDRMPWCGGFVATTSVGPTIITTHPNDSLRCLPSPYCPNLQTRGPCSSEGRHAISCCLFLATTNSNPRAAYVTLRHRPERATNIEDTNSF